MTTTQKVLLGLGTLSLCILVWRIDVNVVRAALLQVGWGLALVLGQEAIAHLLNALGWRFAFPREDAGAFALGELIRLRVAGDAINYLTPTATIGGEVARAAMLSDSRTIDVRATSVIVAKSTQTLAQAFFVTAGLALVATQWISLAPTTSVLPSAIGVGFSIAILAAFRVWPRLAGLISMVWRRGFGARAVEFVRGHPGRVALSTLMFALGYAWGVFEAYWICRFLLIPVPIVTALAIEVLSITVDGILFMVPAKIGTQEGSKVAVFGALGLPATLGFAFGVVRHVRELVWASLGVLLCHAAVGRDGLAFRRAALGNTGRSAAL